MPDSPPSLEPLVLDLLEWIGRRGRPYAEVMDAWRTSCPRLPVWEHANDRRLVEQRVDQDQGRIVVVTPAGAALLAQTRPTRQTSGPIPTNPGAK